MTSETPSSASKIADRAETGEGKAHRRPPGRPPVGPMVNVRMPPDLIARLDAAAEAHGESRAATVRRILEQVVG